MVVLGIAAPGGRLVGWVGMWWHHRTYHACGLELVAQQGGGPGGGNAGVMGCGYGSIWGQVSGVGRCVVKQGLLCGWGRLGGSWALWWGIGAGSVSWCAVVGCWGLCSRMVVLMFPRACGRL